MNCIVRHRNENPFIEPRALTLGGSGRHVAAVSGQIGGALLDELVVDEDVGGALEYDALDLAVALGGGVDGAALEVEPEAVLLLVAGLVAAQLLQLLVAVLGQEGVEARVHVGRLAYHLIDLDLAALGQRVLDELVLEALDHAAVQVLARIVQVGELVLAVEGDVASTRLPHGRIEAHVLVLHHDAVDDDHATHRLQVGLEQVLAQAGDHVVVLAAVHLNAVAALLVEREVGVLLEHVELVALEEARLALGPEGARLTAQALEHLAAAALDAATQRADVLATRIGQLRIEVDVLVLLEELEAQLLATRRADAMILVEQGVAQLDVAEAGESGALALRLRAVLAEFGATRLLEGRIEVDVLEVEELMVLDAHAALGVHLVVVLLLDEAVEEVGALVALVAAVLVDDGHARGEQYLVERHVLALVLGELRDGRAALVAQVLQVTLQAAELLALLVQVAHRAEAGELLGAPLLHLGHHVDRFGPIGHELLDLKGARAADVVLGVRVADAMEETRQHERSVVHVRAPLVPGALGAAVRDRVVVARLVHRRIQAIHTHTTYFILVSSAIFVYC